MMECEGCDRYQLAHSQHSRVFLLFLQILHAGFTIGTWPLVPHTDSPLVSHDVEGCSARRRRFVELLIDQTAADYKFITTATVAGISQGGSRAKKPPRRQSLELKRGGVSLLSVPCLPAKSFFMFLPCQTASASLVLPEKTGPPSVASG